MLGIFHETEAELYPARDPDVIRCQGALQAARALAEPAAQEWKNYIIAHVDEPRSVPFNRHKQRLYDAVQDTSDALVAAEAAHKVALDTATAKANEGWDGIVRQQFLDDGPAIEGLIQRLAQYEVTLAEAQVAGVSRVLNVPIVFFTASEVRTRLEYAKQQLGLEA